MIGKMIGDEASSADPRDFVEIVEYDPLWKDLFEEERRSLLNAIDDLVSSIEHVGSTSIPGLASKPVIDIVAVVEVERAPTTYIERVSPLGYVYQEQEDEPIRIYFRKGMPRTHHLHFVVRNTDQYWDHILFRDYLREHTDEIEEYAELKKDLARRFREDREAYWEGKDHFIKSVLRKARSQRNIR